MDRFRSVQPGDAARDWSVRPTAESGPKHISGILSRVLAQHCLDGHLESWEAGANCLESPSQRMPASRAIPVSGNLPKISFNLEVGGLFPAMTG